MLFVCQCFGHLTVLVFVYVLVKCFIYDRALGPFTYYMPHEGWAVGKDFDI